MTVFWKEISAFYTVTSSAAWDRNICRSPHGECRAGTQQFPVSSAMVMPELDQKLPNYGDSGMEAEILGRGCRGSQAERGLCCLHRSTGGMGGGGRSVPRVPCQARPGFLPVLSAVPARVLHTWCSLSQSPCHCFCFAQRYDRTKLSLKEITNVQYVSCMNPTAGSFTINPRLQVKPCAMAGTSLVLFLCGIFKHEARRKH